MCKVSSIPGRLLSVSQQISFMCCSPAFTDGLCLRGSKWQTSCVLVFCVHVRLLGQGPIAVAEDIFTLIFADNLAAVRPLHDPTAAPLPRLPICSCRERLPHP